MLARPLSRPPVNPGQAAFTLALRNVARPATVQQAMPALAAGGLMALQALPDRQERRSAAVRRGKDLLAGLDRLKAGFLSGGIDRTAVEGLRARLRDARQSTDDPALDELLAHVELRAEVELAKLER